MARRRVMVIALAAAVASALPACSESRYAFVSNKRHGLHLKVPKEWRDVPRDDLLPIYAEAEKQPSPDTYRFLKNVMWERAFDASRTRDVNHFFLGGANAPVVRVGVRALQPEQTQTISIETLRNLTLANYTQRVDGFVKLVNNPGTSELVGADFVPLEDFILAPGPKSNIRDGFSGVRQVFDARNNKDESLYRVAFVGIINDARTRLYTLTMHCNHNCYVKNEATLKTVLDSFTVRKSPL